jgi:outer membrane receptor protein involved in Fe transport
MIEQGNRIFTQRNDTYHYGLGFEGYIDAGTGWDWSTNYSLGRNDQTTTNQGELNMTRVTQSLSNQCAVDYANDIAAGNPVSCVPLNLFGGEGSITPDMLDFIAFTGHNLSGNKLISYDAVISSEIAELPAGPLGFAAGYEHRRASGYFDPDYLISSGQTSGNQANPTKGAYTVDEFYAEFNVPLLSGVTGAQVLEASVAARYSDYDLFGGSTTGKVGLRWKPIDDLLIRGTYSEGLRAPNIFELFGGGGDSFPELDDPCNGGGGSLPGCANVPDTYQQANSQIRITRGSNPNLTPEDSKSFTLGAVYEPSYVDGLVVSIDYYQVELTDVITRLSAQTILNTCAVTGNVLCDRMVRSPSGPVTDINSSFLNAAKLEVEGFDLTASYSFDTDYGLFKVIWDNSYTDVYDFFATSFDENGVIGSTRIPAFTLSNTLDGATNPVGDGTLEDAELSNDTVVGSSLILPRLKSNLTLDWAYGDWGVNYQMRYISGHEETCDPSWDENVRPTTGANPVGGVIAEGFKLCQYNNGVTYNAGDRVTIDGVRINHLDPLPASLGGEALDDTRHIGGLVYHDVNVSYHLADYDTTFSFGIENLFDKLPPVSIGASNNSYEVGLYDGVGRYWWMSVNKRF